MKASLGEERFNIAVSNVHAQLVVPLALKDRVIGMLTLTHETPCYSTRLTTPSLSPRSAPRRRSRLRMRCSSSRSRAAAAMTERQRLARELHDSVSQALYGIALGAKTARTLLDVDAAKAVEPLEYVLQLASAGQAEMRALLFELRPESLALEGLVVALEKQIDAMAARYAHRGRRANLARSLTLPWQKRKSSTGSARRRCTTSSSTPEPAASRCGSPSRNASYGSK